MKTTVSFLLFVLAFGSVGYADRQLKEYDSDVNYDEARIRHYDLPPLLLTAEGTRITTAAQWRTVGRPQILSLFSNLVDDTWADPRGEYAAAYHAGEVYRLLGGKALGSAKLPPLGEAILDSDIGYHVRAGGHSVEPYDWRMFMDFCDRHLKDK